MIRAGITGIIGSGKSTISKIFEILGAKVFYADQAAKDLYKIDAVIQEVETAFGSGTLNQDRQVNLKKLSELVFQNPESIRKINEIIHPRVKSALERWMGQQKESSIIIYESALLFESGFNKIFNKNIVVAAPEEICINRVIKRNGLSADEIKRRMSLQLTNEQKISKADYIIHNDGNSMVLPQVIKLYQELTALRF